MTHNVLNTHQLFLLIAIQKEVVQATNNEPHTWTYIHNGEYLERCSVIIKDKENDGQRTELFTKTKELVKNTIPALDSKLRNFHLHWLSGMEQYTLAEVNEITWYQPNKHKLKNDWDYQGTFTLAKPLTEKELYILEHFSEYKEYND